MEFEFGLPYFGEKENEVYQEFSVRSREYKWRGIAVVRGSTNFSINSIKNLIEDSLSDAKKGYNYTRIEYINGYKCRIKLTKDGWNYMNTSSVEIKIYDRSDEKISIRLEPI
jgi:hypothetical protein